MPGTITLGCPNCSKTFDTQAGPGKRPKYCSKECKEASNGIAGLENFDPVTFFEDPSVGKLINISEKYYTIVDEEDYNELMRYKWYARTAKGRLSVFRFSETEFGTRTNVAMHRQITACSLETNTITRHINNNGFDNRKRNIKISKGVDDVICKKCGNIFQSKVKSTGKRSECCSRLCSDSYVKEFGKQIKEAKCLGCGNVRQLRNNRLFCNRDCRIGYVKRSSEYSSIVKSCSMCGEVKYLYDFMMASSRSGSLKFLAMCVQCHSNRGNKKRTKETARNNNLMSGYGLTIDHYNAILADQGGRCPGCRRTVEEIETSGAKGSGATMHVDHDHVTGKVRGILCHGCNIGLGKFKDNIQILINMLEYMNSFQE